MASIEIEPVEQERVAKNRSKSLDEYMSECGYVQHPWYLVQ